MEGLLEVAAIDCGLGHEAGHVEVFFGVAASGGSLGPDFTKTCGKIHFRRELRSSEKVLQAVDLKGIFIKDVSCSNKSQFHQCLHSGT